MPVLDGYSAVRMLREQGADLPIIALTADGMAEDEERCRSAGCTGYLTKPISMNALLQGAFDQIDRPTLAAAVETSTAVVSARNSASHAVTNTGNSVSSGTQQTDVIPDNPFLREMADLLLNKIEIVIPDVLQALRDQDVSRLADQAHWMKGTGGTVGLPGITAIGTDLEHAVGASDFAAATALILQLQQTTERLSHRMAEISEG
ncbi:MAG: response regulator [Fuerstiella sp.]